MIVIKYFLKILILNFSTETNKRLLINLIFFQEILYNTVVLITL